MKWWQKRPEQVSTLLLCCILIAFLLRMDAPHCDVMVHCLIARLLMLENFNQVPYRATEHVDVWNLEHKPHTGMGQDWVACEDV